MDNPPEPEGRRTLGLFPLTNIVIANMIGAGIFTTSGLLMSDLASPTLLLGLWFVGGIIALCGSLSYGELGAAMPHAGGEYVFLSRLYHPVLGFLSGWTSFVGGFSAPIAAAAIGVSEYLHRAFPQMFEWFPVHGKKLLAMMVIVLFTGIHMRGIKFGTRIQNALTILKVALIAALIVGGLAWGKGDLGHFSEGPEFSFDFGGWKTIGLSLMWILYAYSDWNASTYIGSEVRKPKTTLPTSLFLGTAIVMVLYLLLNVLFVYALSPGDMSGVIAIGGLAMGRMFGESMETVASVLIAFSLFSSLSAFIILGPRVYYAMARGGHFFRFVSYIHPRFGVPTRSIALQAVIAIVLVLSGTFDQILTFMGFSLGIFPLLTVLGVFKLRASGKSSGLSAGFPVAPVVYSLAGTAILILAFFERPLESSIALGTVAAGLPLYVLFKRINRLS